MASAAARFGRDHALEILGVGGEEDAMTQEQPNNPLHGITLEALLRIMVDKYGWEGLGRDLKINCFLVNPSIPSSLKFLRKTPWAREQLEDYYVRYVHGRDRA